MPFGITICSVRWATRHLELAEIDYPRIIINYKHRTVGVTEDVHFAMKFNYPIGALFGNTVNDLMERLMPYVSLAADGYKEPYKEDDSFDDFYFSDSAKEALNTINAILTEYQQDEICRMDASDYYKDKLRQLLDDLGTMKVEAICARDQGNGSQERPFLMDLHFFVSDVFLFQDEYEELCQ